MLAFNFRVLFIFSARGDNCVVNFMSEEMMRIKNISGEGVMGVLEGKLALYKTTRRCGI